MNIFNQRDDDISKLFQDIPKLEICHSPVDTRRRFNVDTTS